MDFVFHAASGALLASALGERRRGWLLTAAGLSVLPDLVWSISALLGKDGVVYPYSHSPLLAAALGLACALVNWRVALGPLMHVLIDLPMHKHSLLFRAIGIEGVNWYQGYGLAFEIGLWIVLLVLATIHVRKRPLPPSPQQTR